MHEVARKCALMGLVSFFPGFVETVVRPVVALSCSSCCSSLDNTLIAHWHYSNCPLIRFPCFPFEPVDLFASDLACRRRHLDLRGVLLHVEFLSAAPQPVGAVCVADVVFDVDV